MLNVKRLQKNLANNMLLYAFLAIITGLVTGFYFNLTRLSALITPTVFIMIYPMMVNLSLTNVKRIREVFKPLVEAMVINFLIAPALMFILTTTFSTPIYMKISLLLLSIAPASSMGLGYLGLAEGHMLTGATIVALAFILSIIVFPIAGYYFTSGTSLHVPLNLIIQNLLVILIAPLILGILTREYIERKTWL